jgi:hypothetical protein
VAVQAQATVEGGASVLSVQLVRQAVGAGRRAYVLVNNRSEVNAPLTVQAHTEMLSKK